MCRILLYFLILPFVLALTLDDALENGGQTSRKLYDITPVTFSNFTNYKFSGFPLYTIRDALFADDSANWQTNFNETTNETETDFLYISTTYLFVDACQQSGGSHNCSLTCSDPAFMFGSLQNLHNCMFYPKIAALYENGSLAPNAIYTAQHLGIPNSKINVSSNPITTRVKTCLLDYCNTPGSACKSAWATLSAESSIYNESDWDVGEDGLVLVTTICNSLSAAVNSDIGGIGVWALR